MIQKFTLLILIVAVLSTSSCITVAPVHGMYEKAGTLGKGGVELSGNYSHYLVGSNGESESVNNNYGFRAGIGLTDNVDLKIRYEKLIPVTQDNGVDFKANYFSLIPKVNFSQEKLSLFVPLSYYHFSSSGSGYKSSSYSYSIAPHLIRTFTAKSNQVDFSPSINLEYIINSSEKGQESDNNFLMGFNLGAGFSSDLRKWAIRPEMGYFFDPTESGQVWNFGIGLQLMLSSAKNKK